MQLDSLVRIQKGSRARTAAAAVAIGKTAVPLAALQTPGPVRPSQANQAANLNAAPSKNGHINWTQIKCFVDEPRAYVGCQAAAIFLRIIFRMRAPFHCQIVSKAK